MELTGFVVVCTIVMAPAWSQYQTTLVMTRSQGACHKYSNDHNGRGMVAYSRPLELPRDVRKFTELCGPKGADCINAIPAGDDK